MVTPRGDRESTLVNLGRSITGGKEGEAKGIETHNLGERGGWIFREGSCNTGTKTGDARVGK